MVTGYFLVVHASRELAGATLWLRVRSGSIRPAMLFHVVYNLGMVELDSGVGGAEMEQARFERLKYFDFRPVNRSAKLIRGFYWIVIRVPCERTESFLGSPTRLSCDSRFALELEARVNDESLFSGPA